MEAMGDATIIHENNSHKKSHYSNKTASTGSQKPLRLRVADCQRFEFLRRLEEKVTAKGSKGSPTPWKSAESALNNSSLHRHQKATTIKHRRST